MTSRIVRFGGVAAGVAALALMVSSCGAVLDGLGGGSEPERNEEGEITASQEADVFSIQVGDCLSETESSTDVSSVPTVPCTDPHDSEVYASIMMEDGEFPGTEAVSSQADEGCLAEFESFVGMAYESSEIYYSTLVPTEGSWAQGDREILCLAYDPTGPTTGTLEGANR